MGSLSAEEYFYKMDNMVLSSCKFLRKVFKNRFKKEMGKDWENTAEQANRFLESREGEMVNSKAQTHHKKIIEKGSLEEWDMSALSVVLQHFGQQTLYKVENEAVRQLTKLRNELAHHPTKKLSREEYKTKVELFRKQLLIVDVDSSEIEKIIVRAGISSSVTALDLTKELLKQGEMHMNAEEFEKAIPFFDEATTISSSIPDQEGAVYEKRAECYLKQANYLKQDQRGSEADKCVEHAMIDATHALELNGSSCEAHFFIGQCYHWKSSCEQAIQHYKAALALSPTSKHVKKRLDSCKALAVAMDNIDTHNVPLNFTEELAHFKEITGATLTEEQLITMMNTEIIKGQADAFRGHQYMNGWGVPQSDKEAASYFAKAAKVGNAEGTCCLGFCYTKGKGVEQNLEKAYKLYLQAAKMSPKWVGGLNKDTSVASAQHSLGLMSLHGVFVEQDDVKAAKWFSKAAKNGDALAAHNLGVMYFRGIGVPINEKKAEMLWKQAVKLKVPKAAYLLVNYYIFHLEVEKARKMFHCGRKLGSDELNAISEDHFNKIIDFNFDTQLELRGKKDRKQLEEDLIAFERMYKLDTKGMTFHERLLRQPYGNDLKPEKDLKNNQKLGYEERLLGKLQKNGICIHILGKMAHEGSITAHRKIEATKKGIELDNFVTENECKSEAEKDHVLKLLYECFTGELQLSSVWMYSPSNRNKLKRFIGQLFNSKSGERGEEEMKIRYCYVCFNSYLVETLSQVELMKEILKQGIKMYPDNQHYYNFLSYLCELNDDSQSVLEWCEKGLQKFPTDVELLYYKASNLHNLHEQKILHSVLPSREMYLHKIVAYYDDFLSHAPPDHPKVPLACYSIAFTYVQMAEYLRDRDCLLMKIEHYYNMGKEAEGKILPMYKMISESDMKTAVENVLVMARAKQLFNPEYPFSMPLSQCAPTPILERLPYLASNVRKRLIVNHRQHQRNVAFGTELSKIYIPIGTVTTFNPKLRQTVPTKLSRLQPVTLSEMNSTSDLIFEDRLIDLTIIEDPYFCQFSTHRLVEDENGDVVRLEIFIVEQNEEAEMNFGHGTTIAIMNPYMKTGIMDGKNQLDAIWNDEPACILYLDKLEKMCGFCGEENAERKCSKCKKPYCSKECQRLDWKRLKHKLICTI